jgi:hypothetical protein
MVLMEPTCNCRLTPRAPARQRRNRFADARGRVAGGLVEHRHRQRPPMRGGCRRCCCESRPPRQQAQGLVVHPLALGRQGKARAPAPAQRQAQAGFQVFHVAADGAGANVQLQLGRRHAAALGHAFEHLQQAQVHVAELAQHGAVFGGAGGTGSAAGAFTCINRQVNMDIESFERLTPPQQCPSCRLAVSIFADIARREPHELAHRQLPPPPPRARTPTGSTRTGCPSPPTASSRRTRA